MSENILESTIQKFITPRRASSRKGQNGTVLVLGGSYIYHGAPILSSLAALRCGTDLVYTVIPKINSQSARAASPNLIVIPLVDQKLTRGAAKKMLGQIPKNLDSAAIGMGLAVADNEALKILIKSLLDMDVRLTLDASSLVRDILPLLPNTNCVITPHVGEFKRLFGEEVPKDIQQRTKIVEKFASKHAITILLKGGTDIITNGEKTFVNTTNTPAMTVGGTGDVLSGICAAMLAKNRKPLESAVVAAFVNSQAGVHAQEKFGLHIVATDLIDYIPQVLKPFDKIIE